MMILRSSPPSPYGRKVKLAAKLLGLFGSIEVQQTDTLDDNDTIRTQNPLGKIPALIAEDVGVLYDSRVICEYLDSLAGGGRLYPSGSARWHALRLGALSDGVMDAAILIVYERRFRPEALQHQPWMDYQRAKVERALASLEGDCPRFGDGVHIGELTLACALGYLDFRFGGDWREGHPKLVAWLDEFAARVPAFEETKPS